MRKILLKGKIFMNDCIFCKIVAGQLPGKTVFENDELIVLEDLHPKAPTHLLVIPKRHISTINDCANQDDRLLGQMILTAKKLAVDGGLSEFGYRLIFNVNEGGGQAVYHIHLHMLGGRQMAWPPG